VGAPHLKDPSKLLASANRIYGDKMQTLWGDFLPVPEAQLHVLHGGDVIDVVGLKFTALDTPGHAYHHMTYRLGDVAFTGDVAGVRISGRQRMRIPSPPPEFDLEAWHASVAKLREQKFTRLYLTHFGVVNDVEAHWANVDRLLDEVTDLIREGMAQGGTRDNLIELYEYWESTRRYTGLLEPAQANSMLAGSGSLGMQIDGLVRYWTKKQQKQA
jgi:glyoxylase-like metal-dependent hydrolase (beta-lactamase superfamily II)